MLASERLQHVPQTQCMSVLVMAYGSSLLLSHPSVLQNTVLCCETRWRPGKGGPVMCVALWLSFGPWPAYLVADSSKGPQATRKREPGQGRGRNQRAAGLQWSLEGFQSQEGGYGLPIIRRKGALTMSTSLTGFWEVFKRICLWC